METVQAASRMDADLFLKHFNMRHRESLGRGKSEISDWVSLNVEEAYRSFHGHIHRYRLDLSHDHGQDEEGYE